MSKENKKAAKFYPNKAENRCAYRNCNNRRGDNGVILFCFPDKTKKAEKYEKWFHNSGINKENTTWRLMICNSHFHGEDFTTYEHQKLLPRAVPIDYRLIEKDVHQPFDPTKVEKVYTNNMSANYLNFIKTEITEEDDSESEKCEEFTFDPTKLKRVYTSNSPHVSKVIKNEDDESDTEKKDLHDSFEFEAIKIEVKEEEEDSFESGKVKSVYIDNSCTESVVIKTEIIIDESERENTILPD
ncbi:uncharacterized protein LOC122498542 [Leptopilina heterotoma]|uniref:uncharacterized protein LOC122498542 n=1 Tax=Leptopilina heterotoma TaxID=63436 RepID=UPI001CA83716|nr:uncharacterized protein LOC122498542 [Leptopilina heterotoma]